MKYPVCRDVAKSTTIRTEFSASNMFRAMSNVFSNEVLFPLVMSIAYLASDVYVIVFASKNGFRY